MSPDMQKANPYWLMDQLMRHQLVVRTWMGRGVSGCDAEIYAFTGEHDRSGRLIIGGLRYDYHGSQVTETRLTPTAQSDDERWIFVREAIEEIFQLYDGWTRLATEAMVTDQIPRHEVDGLRLVHFARAHGMLTSFLSKRRKRDEELLFSRLHHRLDGSIRRHADDLARLRLMK